MGKAADGLILGAKFIEPLVSRETLGNALLNAHKLPCRLSLLKDVSRLVQFLSTGIIVIILNFTEFKAFETEVTADI